MGDLYQGAMSVEEYFTRMKALWDQISGINPIHVCTCNNCTCNQTQKFLKAQQDERLVQFLMRLNNKYASIRTNILMMQPLPNVALAHRLVIQEEKQQYIAEIGNQSNNSMAFAASSSR